MAFEEISAEEVMATRDTLEQGINCVICTGDNTTTGVSIGRQCGIIQALSLESLKLNISQCWDLFWHVTRFRHWGLWEMKVLIGECSESPESSGIRWRDVDAKETSATTWRREGFGFGISEFQGSVRLALSQSAFRWLLREQREELKEMLPAVKDKIKVITLWQSYGDEGAMVSACLTVTGMTGDGGNDCGALRTAHAGLALSEAEATNMATFIYFMIYNLMLTSTKLAVLTWTEWQFILTDVGLAMVMVSRHGRQSYHGARLASSRTPEDPKLASALLIYWLTAGVALLLLQYGPGRTFYEFGSSILSEIPVNEWTKKSDNYLIVYAPSDTPSKNWRMCSFYALGIAFTLALTWAKPGDFSCTFRINCDTVTWRGAEKLCHMCVAGVIFSCGNLGGCFLGPQMVSCKSKEFGLNSSWDPPAGVVQPPGLDLTNTDVVRRGLKRVQMPLHAGTARPVLPVYMDAKTTPNFIRLFELFCEVIKKNLRSPEPSFVSGTSLHKVGQSSAAEYWMHRDCGNHCVVECKGTKFWIMRSQAADTAAPAQASIQPRTARRLVDMLYMSEAEARQSFLDSEIMIRTESGGYRISISELELLFGAHAVVMEGPLPGEYCPKVYRVEPHATASVCAHVAPLSSGLNARTCISLQVCRVRWTSVTFLRSGSQGARQQKLPRRKRVCARAQVARSASVASGREKFVYLPARPA
ncbi:Vacuolar cation-transporting ATPase YPK9 [Symbiodinium microadriaticum]|uniref:Vacuolar cation-transporting ATPase YPK9 n=1 Tax=Symbiodinium microadriaticum TaxID=2951 RepID=A0A1Q9F654_SYMMI|nr:Vacuolar cation-transporting ATPase YPK9 [Symbiodinium microadriaticum]